jgi:hypothetical protein
MAAKKRTRGNPIPLIREDHPEDYTGYPFITLIQYRKENVLTIVDNSDDKHIRAFILDLCAPSQVDEERIIEVAAAWYGVSHERYPISFEFSRAGISGSTTRIYRSFNIEFVTRVIGPLPKFEMGAAPSIKRRRRKPVPPGVEIKKKVLDLTQLEKVS